MSNFMPLRQLITDLINTLWLAILKQTGGRAFSASVCVCVTGSGCVRLRWRDRGAGDRGCQHAHPSRRRPPMIDIGCVFRAINQEPRLKMMGLKACGHAGWEEAIVVIVILATRRVSRPRSPDEYR